MPERTIKPIQQSGRFRRGMTFTEVLVATLILSLAMVPILRAMGSVHLFSAKMEKNSRCLILAQNQMEELKARAASDYASCRSVSNKDLGEGYLCSIAADGDSLFRIVSVSVGYDENQNGLLDTEEVLLTLRTGIANLQEEIK